MPRALSDIPLLVVLMGATALAMLVPAAHAAVLEDERVARAFAQSALLVMLLAAMIGVVTQRPGLRETRHSYLISLGGAYLLLPLLMALPVAEAVRNTTFTNAWFEMVSCFTTTGATLYDAPGRLGESLHLWRALVGWLGGFFILIMAGAVLAPLNLGGTELVSGQTPGRSLEGLSQITATAEPSRRLARQALDLFPVYTALTLALWIGLRIAGESGLLALCHAMSALSTSGISPGPGPDQTHAGLASEVLIFLFLAVSVSRRLLPGLCVTDRSVPLWRDPELRLAAIILGSVSALLLLRHAVFAGAGTLAVTLPDLLGAAWGALFTGLSFLTTTGFESGFWDLPLQWSGVGSPGLVLVGLAITGGGVATTAGGVKLLRGYALMRHGQRELERIVHPNAVGGLGPAERRLRRGGAMVAWVFFMLFAATIATVTGALTLAGLEFEPALVFCLSALTLTGPLAEVAAAAPLDWAPLGGLAKFILGATMVVGRLEVLAVLALVSLDNWRR